MSVSRDDLWVAAQWLDVNEGAEDAEACARVAAMLRSMIEQREAAALRAQIKKELVKAGLPVTDANIDFVLRSR